LARLRKGDVIAYLIPLILAACIFLVSAGLVFELCARHVLRSLLAGPRARPTLFVPVSSVARDLERTFVVRVRDHRADWVDVKTGATSGDLIEVFDDLAGEDEVALRGTDQVRPGTIVSPSLVDSHPR
jgi:hypothetical protein